MKVRFACILILALAAAFVTGCRALPKQTGPTRGYRGKKVRPISEVQKGIVREAIPRLEGTRSSLSKTWILLGMYPIEDYLVDKNCRRSPENLSCLFKFRNNYKILISWDKDRTITKIVAGEVEDWTSLNSE